MTTIRRLLGAAAAACLVAGGGLPSSPLEARQGWPLGLANYRDAAEIDARLVQLADNSSHAQVHTIGSSIDYQTNPLRATLYPIRAIRVSASTDERVTDDVRKNAILCEAGSHAREWLSSEGALALAEYLVNNAENAATDVPDLLRAVDVWIVPLTNVAGRIVDDRRGGDPRFFSTDPMAGGWRGNADTRGCEYGINIARNFSAGWSGETSIDCVDDPEGTAQDPVDGRNNDAPSDYRGFAPFSTLEAAALRQFVQNHSISMAVVMHSNAQQIWNLWGNGDAAGSVIANRARDAFNATPDESFALQRDGVGSGLGQFSAWLSADSNQAGQPDNGTARRIQTVFVELPIDTYTDADRYQAADGSNGFHPSRAATMRTLRSSIVDMGLELIRDAASPGCVVVLPWSPADWQGGCLRRDFALVGAKLGHSSTQRGSITTTVAGCLAGETERGCPERPVPARDSVPAGTYTLYYRVQNFSSDAANTDVDVRLRLASVQHLADGDVAALPTTTLRSHTLAMQQAEWSWFSVNLGSPGTDYTLTLEIVPRGTSTDGFSTNNRKVFKVSTPAR
jgi:hypothetical protein